MGYLIGLIYAIHILVCFFLIIVVLLQSGKSGDIAAAFGGMGSQTAFRSAWSGNGAFQGDHLVGGTVHGDLDHAVDLCGSAQWYDDEFLGIRSFRE